MNFCSHCGSDQLAFTVPAGDNRARFVCGACQTIHYQNPKIVAGCLPLYGDQVLLCRRAIEPRRGYWNVPSGYLENGETLEAGAAREVYEEALARVSDLRLHTVYSIPHINQVYVHFLADLEAGRFAVGPESLESKLFDEAAIPWEEIAFSSSVYSLRRYFADRERGEARTHVGTYQKLI